MVGLPGFHRSVDVSNYYQNPGNASFRDFPPGPHSGVDPDEDQHVAPDSLDSHARTALTLGLLSLLLSVLTGIPAIWVGVKALKRINAANGALKGRWAAWTGIALGCLSVLVLGAGWLYLHAHS
jgi:ABC-type Fe3+ transport system permease subunit